MALLFLHKAIYKLLYANCFSALMACSYRSLSVIFFIFILLFATQFGIIFAK